MLAFAIGIVVGLYAGVILMACMCAASDADAHMWQGDDE